MRLSRRGKHVSSGFHLPLPVALAMAVALLVVLFAVAVLLPPVLSSPASSPDLGASPTVSVTEPGTPEPDPSASTADPQVSATPQATDTPAPTTTAAASPAPAPTATATRKPAPTAAPVPTSRPTDEAGLVAWENQVTTLVNAERKKVGCGALRTDERLRTAARAHSADMVKYNFFSHRGHDGSSFVDRLKRAGYTSGAAAENIAYGYATPAAVVKGWMGSAGHKANIVNCGYKAVGVGLAYRDSTPYWTQDFGRI